MILFATINDCLASFEIKTELDGIYQVKLLNKISGLPHRQLPRQIILIKTNGKWSSDYFPKEPGLMLGDKIDEYESGSFQNI